MPKQVLPDVESFRHFEQLLFEREFRKIAQREVRGDMRRLRLTPPTPREGREAGFTFTANGLTVVVWTTFVEAEGKARESDAGWVLIKGGDMPLYFARPVHRTKNFFTNLFWLARIARWKVSHRPLCPECHAHMDIAFGRGLKARYWRCRKPAHPYSVRLSWDHGLHPDALAYLARLRKERKAYRKREREAGREPGSAQKRRKGWSVGAPHNKLP